MYKQNRLSTAELSIVDVSKSPFKTMCFWFLKYIVVADSLTLLLRRAVAALAPADNISKVSSLFLVFIDSDSPDFHPLYRFLFFLIIIQAERDYNGRRIKIFLRVL